MYVKYNNGKKYCLNVRKVHVSRFSKQKNNFFFGRSIRNCDFSQERRKNLYTIKKKCNFIPLTGKNVTHLKTFKIVSECGLMVTFKYFNFCLS